ncbi:MAG: methyltransferase domain-containing protein [Deltaproteobacteria bacterium]|nr:methyltransferase domain-containing protein [Deltaproteobacteria bacterium]
MNKYRDFSEDDPLPAERLPLLLKGSEDSLFSHPGYPHPFEFNEEVAAVFDDMVSRSVPLYQEVIHCLVEWAWLTLRPGDRVCDLGCSTGTSMQAIGQQISFPLHFYGVDQSEAMLARAADKLSLLQPLHQIILHHGDLESALPEDCSLVILNYTLQFVPVERRQAIMNRIFESLKPGGLLFYSEKTRSQIPDLANMMTCSYESFKRRHGYSVNEISRKKEALDKVLLPFTRAEHLNLLDCAGFKKRETIFQWHQFTTFVAVKE